MANIVQKRITVTQKDIDSGSARSCSSCPVALAAKRVFYRYGGVSEVDVGLIEMSIFYVAKVYSGVERRRIDILMPHKAHAFIARFDEILKEDDLYPKPFWFTVWVDEDLLEGVLGS